MANVFQEKGGRSATNRISHERGKNKDLSFTRMLARKKSTRPFHHSFFCRSAIKGESPLPVPRWGLPPSSSSSFWAARHSSLATGDEDRAMTHSTEETALEEAEEIGQGDSGKRTNFFYKLLKNNPSTKTFCQNFVQAIKRL